MIKGTTRKRTYRAIYRLLDRVSPVPFDCGTICGSACCTAVGEEDMGIYLLPGEEKIHDKHADWLTWNTQSTEEYDFPPSWHGKVNWIRCKEPPHCPREMRPIQCRTFPLSPHIDEDGIFHIILCADELPYECPLIRDFVRLNDDFIRATYTCWKHLIRDPKIMDLVLMDSEDRTYEEKPLVYLYP